MVLRTYCLLMVIQDHHEECYAVFQNAGATHLMHLDLMLRDPLESRSTLMVKGCKRSRSLGG
jgi:hypothetical protein